MNTLRTALTTVAALMFSAAFCLASIAWWEIHQDIIIIGEYHDTLWHHGVQQNAVNEIKPKAVVFEMLTPEEAEQLANTPRSIDAMVDATQGFHWSNIADYAEILAVSGQIVGAALSREDMRAAFSNGAASVFGDEAALYGLTTPLPAAEQEAREALQFDAHCAAMPLEMMPGMVEAQRLRDAAFARAVLEALDTYGAPVVLITGNGHARTDWGVPVYLKRARPDVSVKSYGQGENGTPPPGTFDALSYDGPAPERPDPCAAFK